MTNKGHFNWYDDFLGVAYRYFDLRMNVIPLFSTRKKAVDLWNKTIHWWVDPTIKLRFVESKDTVWFILAAESKKEETNLSFFKQLPKSQNYERFKKGSGGEAYLRLGIYEKKFKKDVKDDFLCNCGHSKEDHDEEITDECLYDGCSCKKFESFQVTLLKKKKTITDIKFLSEDKFKEDALSWNCLYVNKYKN